MQSLRIAKLQDIRESWLVKRVSLVLTLWSVLLAGMASACVRVKPHERAIHAKPAMQDSSPVESKLDEHVKQYREGSVGGMGTGGGGCGCN